MWLGESALILAISTAVLGLLFAIRRILARVMILPHDANPSRMEFSEGTGSVLQRQKEAALPLPPRMAPLLLDRCVIP
jgi:hypothetical protein